MNYRKALLDKLVSFDFERNGQAMPVISLEDFFTGNDEKSSIGCNLSDHPGLPFFFETLKFIRNKDNVQDVLIEITDVDTLKEPHNEWAFSDRIYVISSANLWEVKGWLTHLSPDEIEEGWIMGKSHLTAPTILENYKVYSAWWN